jgi:hypothetical protein
MKKITLLLSKFDCTSFHQPAFSSCITDFFNIQFIEDQLPHDKHATLLVVNYLDLNTKSWYIDLYQHGYKLLIDNLWGLGISSLPNSITLLNQNWFWYHESLLYKSLGYHTYVHNKSYNKLALMPMGLIKESHDLLYDAVSEYLDQLVYSYIERFNRYLPEDLPPQHSAQPGVTGQHQRYFNPNWYDSTYFSLVSETVIDGQNFPLHVTEKTFKPIAYRHPFLIWGQPGVLNFLHNLGFETFENLFNESYDTIQCQDTRLKQILYNLANFKQEPYDQLTISKLEHNHRLFFNTDLVKSRIHKEIVEPINEFACSYNLLSRS